MRRLLPLFLLALAGCLSPPGAAERATDAARDLNLAARFGRMDVAIELTNPAVRKQFAEHRAKWGKEIRVLDVEMGGLNMVSGDRADVEVDYSWTRLTDGTLRTTRVAQEWRDNGGGFLLARERRLSGDLGLFGEALPAPAEEGPRQDVQFATKVIR